MPSTGLLLTLVSFTRGGEREGYVAFLTPETFHPNTDLKKHGKGEKRLCVFGSIIRLHCEFGSLSTIWARRAKDRETEGRGEKKEVFQSRNKRGIVKQASKLRDSASNNLGPPLSDPVSVSKLQGHQRRWLLKGHDVTWTTYAA